MKQHEIYLSNDYKFVFENHNIYCVMPGAHWVMGSWLCILCKLIIFILVSRFTVDCGLETKDFSESLS